MEDTGEIIKIIIILYVNKYLTKILCNIFIFSYLTGFRIFKYLFTNYISVRSVINVLHKNH